MPQENRSETINLGLAIAKLVQMRKKVNRASRFWRVIRAEKEKKKGLPRMEKG